MKRLERIPRPALLAGAIVAALLLAFPLRGAVQVVIIQPILYVWWMLLLAYRFVPQQILWILLVVLLLYVANVSFTAKPIRRETGAEQRGPRPGPVETLADWIRRSPHGVYFKWEVAHILAQTALNIVQLGRNNDDRKLEWDVPPAPAVDRYLDAGLNTSFADYPLPPFPFQKPKPTPFDTDLVAVVEFLESQLEQNHDQ